MEKSKIFLLFFWALGAVSYPQNSIRCYHTLARPDRQLICPQSRSFYFFSRNNRVDRNSYCMKEVSNLPESLCGLTQYFGDYYNQGQCIYKKCIDECVEGQYEFYFEGQKYNRKRYCCNNDDLCNGNDDPLHGVLLSDCPSSRRCLECEIVLAPRSLAFWGARVCAAVDQSRADEAQLLSIRKSCIITPPTPVPIHERPLGETFRCQFKLHSAEIGVVWISELRGAPAGVCLSTSQFGARRGGMKPCDGHHSRPHNCPDQW
jgi:hypothetical protein